MVVYEQSEAERQFLCEKQQRRAALRAQYIKQSTNPHRHATGEGGVLFDPQLQRFQAMRVSHYEHFKPTGRSLKNGLFLCVLPIIAYTYLIKCQRDCREKKFRSGEVAYKDRQFKFI